MPRVVSIGLVALLAHATSLSAAVLSDVRLVMDGSTRPPGDLIRCFVQCAEDEPGLTIEVRGFTIDDPAAAPLPVIARGQANRDADGKLLVTRQATNADGPEVDVVVPYADLALDAGEHSLGYVVTLRAGNEVLCVRPLPATKVRVHDGVRVGIDPRPVGAEPSIAPERTKVYIDQAGATAERQMNLSQVQATPRAAAVNAPVPNGYERSTIDGRAQIANPELKALSDQPWQPLASVAGPNDRVVYFATTRNLEVATSTTSGAATSRPQFGVAASSDITFGRCTVNFPVRNHHKGDL
ncbi:MAG TPA: hypothetical protein VG713_07045, partial [Pirellulales bacterium]|nr:hypothetical protein [Pirellulales bacterium]